MRKLELLSPEGNSPAIETLSLTGNALEDMGRVSELLAGYTEQEIAAHLAAISHQNRPVELIGQDRDKLTHYKWKLAQGPGYGVWLHNYVDVPADQFSCMDLPVGGQIMVERNHNHTGALVSRLLRQGYATQELRNDTPGPPIGLTPGDTENWKLFAQSLRPQIAVYNTGDIMTLHPDEIHRIAEVGKGTVSLLVKLGPIRDFSVVFDDKLQPVEYHKGGKRTVDDLLAAMQAVTQKHPFLQG
jgi:hypothetical protein